MRCDFCQNYPYIAEYSLTSLVPEITIEKLVKDALSSEKNIGMAFTYNEPVIWFEFMRDAAVAAKEEGLYTVMVSNGFVNPDPLERNNRIY